MEIIKNMRNKMGVDLGKVTLSDVINKYVLCNFYNNFVLGIKC